MRHFVHNEAGFDHNNEDLVRVARHASGAMLCILADGMGGQFGGARAAAVAVEKSIESALALSANDLRREAHWVQVASVADDTAEADIEAGFTTLIALCIDEDTVCGASCGDSAVLLMNSDKPILLTENQRKNPPVGSGDAQPTSFSQKLKAQWKLLVMSDGVWKFVGRDSIIKTCHTANGTDLILSLRESAAGQSGKLPDDFSMALFESD